MGFSLAGKQQNGHHRTWFDKQGCPEVSSVTSMTGLTLLQPHCYELLRGMWVSVDSQAEPCTGTGCQHIYSFPFCDGDKDLGSCLMRFSKAHVLEQTDGEGQRYS